MTRIPTLSSDLAGLIRHRKEELLASWRKTVRLLDVAKDLDASEINDHIGGLLEELAQELERGGEDSVIEAGGPEPMRQIPVIHGQERLSLGFDLEEIVYEYNALRSAILNLAETYGVSLVGSPGHTLNRVLDGAVGTAVKAYARQQAELTRKRRHEYLTFVVHDLRSPLSAISLAADVLRRQISCQQGSEEDQTLELIELNARKLERQTQRILMEDAGIRQESEQNLDCAWINLHALVESLLLELKPLAERSRVQFQLTMDPALKGFVDESRVALIFQNLLSNAIRYTHGGTITVTGSRTSTGVQCCVEDNGSGIEMDRLDKIFLAGESDDPDGFGLGLAIVKTLVNAHQGTIQIESQPGQGSRFILHFPDPDGSDVWAG